MKSWKQLSIKEIHLNRHRSMYKARYRSPSGWIGDFYMSAGPDIICALVLTPDKRAVLVRQFRMGPNEIVLDLPGGGVNRGETPRRAAAREVLEETGYRGKVKFLVTSWDEAWARKRRHHFLITDAVRIAEPKNDPTEITEPVLLTIPQLRKQLRLGKIYDTQTAFLALDYLKWL